MDNLPTRWEPSPWPGTMELENLEEGTLAASHHNSSGVLDLRITGECALRTPPGHDSPGDTNRDDVFLILDESNPGGGASGWDIGCIGPWHQEAATGGASANTDCESDCSDDEPTQEENNMGKVECSPHPWYASYCLYPIRVLSKEARKFLSDHLNQKSVVGERRNDWEGLADHIGMNAGYVYKKDYKEDPCGELLKDWEQEEGRENNIGKLLVYLERMHRHDILNDLSFMPMIADSVGEYYKGQEELARASEERRSRRLIRRSSIKTCGEVISGRPEKFDAFVCYDEADTDFIMELIYELEYTEGLKVCLNARDLLLGDEADVTAEIIKSRCKRTLVILSKTFVQNGNPMCDFALRIAQSLNPAASESKLIPIRIDSCDIPVSLRHIEHVDFEECHVRPWLWGRLAATLRLQEEDLLNVEKQKLRRVILHRSDGGSGTDVRASMRETRYIPPLPAKRSSSSSSSSRVGSTSSSIEEPCQSPPRRSRSRAPNIRDRFWSFLSGSRSKTSGH